MPYNKVWYREYVQRNRERINAYHRKWSKDNKEKRNRYTNSWKRRHKDAVRLMKRRSYLKNRKKAIATVKRYYKINKNIINLKRKPQAKIYREKNKDRINLRIKEWSIKNKDRISLNNKRWVAKNRKRVNFLANIRMKKLRLENISYRLSQNIGIDMWHALRDKKYSKRWQKLVNYSTEDLMKHLESLFDENMNWGNYGTYWEIDHIKPRSLFKFKSYDDIEFKECWSLSNLQPLEKRANRIKHNKYAKTV